MTTNVLHHRIDSTGLARKGAIVGIVSAVLMAICAMIVTPLVSGSLDAWSFPRAIATIIMGSGAAHPTSGFAVAPVVVGLALHLVIGAVVGTIFALIVGYLDIEEAAPITILGLVYGVVVYLVTWVLIGSIAFDALGSEPMIAVFWSHVIFGITAGAMLANWERTYDLDSAVSE